MAARVEADARGTRLFVKVVPGAKRDQVAGILGDRLKVRVKAPPEDGRANEAVCRMIAAALGLPARSVSVIAGRSNPEKVLLIEGLSPDRVAAALGLG